MLIQQFGQYSLLEQVEQVKQVNPTQFACVESKWNRLFYLFYLFLVYFTLKLNQLNYQVHAPDLLFNRSGRMLQINVPTHETFVF